MGGWQADRPYFLQTLRGKSMAIADNDNIASQKHSPFSVVVFIKYRACLRNTVLIVKDSFGKGTNRCTLRYLYQSRLFANRREHATTASLHSLHHHGTFLVIHVHTHMVAYATYILSMHVPRRDACVASHRDVASLLCYYFPSMGRVSTTA